MGILAGSSRTLEVPYSAGVPDAPGAVADALASKRRAREEALQRATTNLLTAWGLAAVSALGHLAHARHLAHAAARRRAHSRMRISQVAHDGGQTCMHVCHGSIGVMGGCWFRGGAVLVD